MPDKRIILAADGISLPETVELCKQFHEHLYAVKIHDLYDVFGGYAVHDIRNNGVSKVFIDAKLHDIPNTVRRRREVMARSGAGIITVHASGGIEMMKAAAEDSSVDIYAVTVLTSLSGLDVCQSYGRDLKMVVIQYADWAYQAGVKGVVCSAEEVSMLRKIEYLRGLKLIVPGTRSSNNESHDQKRVSTPGKAIKDGADYVVIGRQITQANDKRDAFNSLVKEIEEAIS